jgi:hypothetical protein
MNDKEKQHQDRLKKAMDFLKEFMSSTDMQSQLEGLESFKQVKELAARRGYELDHTSFAQAMKIMVDQSLERSGIPSWVRYRIHAPVHD